jgi:hypothetical protein
MEKSPTNPAPKAPEISVAGSGELLEPGEPPGGMGGGGFGGGGGGGGGGGVWEFTPGSCTVRAGLLNVLGKKKAWADELSMATETAAVLSRIAHLPMKEAFPIGGLLSCLGDPPTDLTL